METRCRLCAECSINQLSILENFEFCSKIFHLFQIKVSVGDNLPSSVCHDCYDMVEKTWTFNDRIQKAQDVLAELANNIGEVLPNSGNLGTASTDTQNNTSDVIHLNYIDTRGIENGSFLSEDVNDLSDTSEKSEHKLMPPVVWRKRKHPRNKKRKDSRKKNNINHSNTLENIEFEINEDGNINPKNELLGWDAYPWTCTDCNLFFTASEDLKDHYATAHNSNTRYSCADCPKVYTKFSIFLAHVRIHRTKLRLCCDICYKWFPTGAEQEQHRSQHGDDRPHACNTCGKKFRMQSALMVHARSHLPSELKNRFQCDQCHQKFGTKPNLMAHKRIHTGIREYTCDQCGKSFVQKGNLDNHLLTHTAARPFNCDICGKAFKTLVRLRKHGSVHSGLKPHQCDICGRQFRERATLKEHHRIHTGAMPFSCEFCGKSFRFKGVLTTHRRQHTGERPYSCNECQHHFTNWPNYNKHMKRRHGINTSVTCRTRQDIPPTGMPHRNPPGTVLAPPQTTIPQPVVITDHFIEPPPTFYPVLNLYNIPEELLQQRV